MFITDICVCVCVCVRARARALTLLLQMLLVVGNVLDCRVLPTGCNIFLLKSCLMFCSV